MIRRRIQQCLLRNLSTTTTAAPKTSLRILVVDGYQEKSREEFEKTGLPLASTLYSNMLREQGLFDDIHLEFDTIFPCQKGFQMKDTNLEDYDGACFTGSSMSAYSTDPDCTIQIEIMKDLFKRNISTFGSCWGIQIAAMAIGGNVELSPKGREVGIGRKVSVTESGKNHPMFRDKKNVFEAFMSHSDEVTTIPDSDVVEVLAGNDHSKVQAMSVQHGDTESWFVQYHPEYDLKYFAGLISTRKKRMTDMGFFLKEDDIDLYVQELCDLHENPELKHVKWKYGIDDDIMDTNIKRREVRNWLRYLRELKGE